MKPIFYRRYVDGYINRRDKNARDTLFESLNNYHKKIKFTIEKDPSKFLDTEIVKTRYGISTALIKLWTYLERI